MSEAPPEVRRIVLLGFMGSGKSTVGPALANRLGWDFVDFDTQIESTEGCPIAEIFRLRGESHFRTLEAVLTREMVGRERIVLSPGGGWITNPGWSGLLGQATLTVWLKVSPETVLERVGSTIPERPLLDTPDPSATVRRLMAEREPQYRRADRIVIAEGRGVDAIVDEIVVYLHERMFPGVE